MPDYSVVGARGRVANVEQLLSRLGGARSGNILALDADLVCGREHLESAVEHALRAFERGTNSANNVMMETLLFASGERQISRAQERMSLREGAERVALVLFGGSEEEALLLSGLERDDSVLGCDQGKLMALGISEAELRAVPPEKAADLALERVAFVEVLKR